MITRRPRFDRIQVRLDMSERIVDKHTGYLNVWGTVVSANQFLEYDKADGAAEDGWVEFVPESTVFDERALETLINVPVTLNHPPEMLDSVNTERYQVGSVIEIKRDGDKLRALHQITSQRAIDAIMQDGIFELSPGYTAEIDDTPGSFGGRSYRTMQAGRVYNHDSIVPEARAGPENKLDGNRSVRMDGLLISKPTQNKKEDNKKMADEKTSYEIGDEMFKDLPPAIVAKLDAMDAESSKSKEDEEDEKKDAEEDDEKEDGGHEEDDEEEDKDSKKSSSRGDALTRTEFDSAIKGIQASVLKANRQAEKERTDASAERETVISAAKGHLPASFKFDGKTPAEIMYHAIVTSNPDAKPAAERNRKSSAALRGMFAMLGTPRTDGKPIGGNGKDIQGSSTMRMDAAVKRREARVDQTQRTFRSVGKIGLQLVEHVANTFEDAQGKVG